MLIIMSTQHSQNHKRQEQNNTDWLDEMINKLEEINNNTTEKT